MTYQQAPRNSAASAFQPDFCAARARRRVLVAAILASAMGFIDGTIVSIAMPAMRDSLGATLSQAQWINNAYLLPLAALILTGGAMGDRFGTGRVFTAGIVVFVIASLVCAAAPSAELLIAGRVLKGIGAALMVPGSLALIYKSYPEDARGGAIGTWAGASALTTAIGPVLGGAAITVFGDEAWRWLFAMNLPLGFAAVWLVRSAIESDPGQPDHGIDFPGAMLAALGLGLAAWALTGLGGAGGASLMTFAVAVLALVLFILWERISPHPMMPLDLFREARFSAANLATFFLYFSLSAILFFLPMTVISGWGVTEAEASAAFLPLTALIAVFSARAGRIADRVGPGILIAIGAGIVALAFATLAATVSLQAFWWIVLPAMCLMGAGMSLVVAPLSTAVMGAVPEAASGAASGINNAISRIASLVAVAVMGALAASVYSGAGGTASFGGSATGDAHVVAMNAGFAAIAWLTAGLSALSGLVAWRGIRQTPQAGS